MLKLATAFCPLVWLVGCSTIPRVEYSYYFAKSTTVLSVAQTATRDGSKANLIVITAAPV
jgi:hypothetical protein